MRKSKLLRCEQPKFYRMTKPAVTIYMTEQYHSIHWTMVPPFTPRFSVDIYMGLSISSRSGLDRPRRISYDV
jgi:hypothetical protein